MSRYPRAGREHSQAASPSWPTEIFHTIDTMLSLLIRVGPLFLAFGELHEIRKFWRLLLREWLSDRSSGGEKKLYCV